MTRILLVEDDPVSQDIVKGILESRGWTVDTASDGFASINMLREQHYTAALIDYHLPEMDGYALARLMRDIGNARQQPLRLIGMTADRHGLAGRRGVDRVFDDILAKPFAPTDLLTLLDTVAPRRDSSVTFAKLLATLQSNPDTTHARAVSSALWRARGLTALPKAYLVPEPSPDQENAISLCFDIVDEGSAELVLIVDAQGFHDLIRTRRSTVSQLPIITTDPALIVIADSHFSVADATSWSRVAALVQNTAPSNTSHLTDARRDTCRMSRA